MRMQKKELVNLKMAQKKLPNLEKTQKTTLENWVTAEQSTNINRQKSTSVEKESIGRPISRSGRPSLNL